MALIYPDAWPICPDGCTDGRGEVQRLNLLVERGEDRVRAFLHCASCGLEEPAALHGFKTAAAVASSEGRGVVVEGWVPADAVLPDEDGLVLGYVPEGDPDKVWPVLYEDGRWFDCDGATVLVVTHWTPLPAPPA